MGFLSSLILKKTYIGEESMDMSDLVEAFGSTATKYGNNYPAFDNRMTSSKNGTNYTLISYKDAIYICELTKINSDTCEISFGLVTNYNDGDIKLTYAETKANPYNSYGALSRCFFVIEKMVEGSNFNNVVFWASTDKHKKIYESLLKNSGFKDKLRRLGFIKSGSNFVSLFYFSNNDNFSPNKLMLDHVKNRKK